MPGRVLAIDGELGTVDFWGTQRVVRLELLEEPVIVGDHVLCSLGCAMRRISPEDVEELMAMYADAVVEEAPA